MYSVFRLFSQNFILLKLQNIRIKPTKLKKHMWSRPSSAGKI